MRVLYFEAIAETCSIRIPEAHTFQPTLPNPTPTNMIGLLGAAMGLSYKEAQEFVINNEIKFGINGSSSGFMRDFQKMILIKGNSYHEEPLYREVHCWSRFHLFYSSEKGEIFDQITKAFKNPVYPPVFGRSDDLLKIKKLSTINDAFVEKSFEINNSVLLGNYKQNIKVSQEYIDEQLKNGKYIEIVPPKVYSLPIFFKFANGDTRIVNKRSDVMFVSTKTTFDITIDTVKISDDIKIPVIDLKSLT